MLTAQLSQAQVTVADVLGQHHISSLNVVDDAAVQVSIYTAAADGPSKIYLFIGHNRSMLKS